MIIKWPKSILAYAKLSLLTQNSDLISEIQDFESLYEWGIRERTLLIIYNNLRKFSLPDWFIDRCERVSRDVIAKNLINLNNLSGLIFEFNKNGIEVIPYKGISLIGLLYPIGLRSMNDIDILIKEKDRKVADKIITDMGYVPNLNHRNFSNYPDANLASILYYPAAGQLLGYLHMHWKVFNTSVSYKFTASEDVHHDLWNSSVTINNGGFNMKILEYNHAFVLSCEHAMKHSYDPLIHLVDIIAMMNRRNINNEHVVLLAKKWNMELPVFYAAWFSRNILGCEKFKALEQKLKPRNSSFENYWILKMLACSRRGHGVGVLGYLSMVNSGRKKFNLILRTIAPDQKSMRLYGKKPSIGPYFFRVMRGLNLLAGTLAGRPGRS